VEVFEEAFGELIDPSARLERVADGFVFIEGPVWDFGARHLTFSDLVGSTVYRYDETGGARVYRQPSDFSNGMTLDDEGNLVVCEHRTRRVSRETPGGFETVVDRYEGKRLNSPNDVVPARDGSLLFTDPPFGLTEEYGGIGEEQELSFQGVFRVPPGSGEPELLTEDLTTPNGLVLSPSEDTLYVADTEEGHVRAFGIGQGWTLSGGEVLVELPQDDEGVPDGLKADTQGNLFCTGPGGIWVCSPAGDLLGRIPIPEVAANLNWGDADARTMYITASTTLYRFRCRTTGYVPYRRA
jgi:gluconolactonase